MEASDFSKLHFVVGECSTTTSESLLTAIGVNPFSLFHMIAQVILKIQIG